MSGILSNIPIVPWVQRTMNKMNENQEESRDKWKDYWYESYKELAHEINARITTSGIKPCPSYGTYGLWYLGYIVDSSRNFQNWSIEDILCKDIRNNKKLGRKKVLGKNAVYAVLALKILNEYQQNINYTQLLIDKNLWEEVKKRYLQYYLTKDRDRTARDKTATKDQGEVKIAMELFKAKLIVIP
ncbi:hypothetical protein H6G80_21200 [Nostoc sp. FACHB-87]|uniref:hypothetical protein n=1 Tax=Nostocaceae TaxID=1162 RepID=UPI00168585E2|nr:MULTISPECIES: hypothetical protein [Nostocaceae]MBD2456583.1 hypothetical protein [Nostoc sp. FACHB-87]MBD2477234.1 hypothetical protein [Anabaena sp. FACHB-83]